MQKPRGENKKVNAPALDQDSASKAIKRYAADQKVRIKLSSEQIEEILRQWNDKDPRRAAEITFYADDRPLIELQVAGYRYRGDTCCV